MATFLTPASLNEVIFFEYFFNGVKKIFNCVKFLRNETRVEEEKQQKIIQKYISSNKINFVGSFIL